MLHLRVYGEPDLMEQVAARLDGLAGTRHVSVAPTGSGASTLVTADVRAAAADSALAMLRELGVPGEDIALVRLDSVSLDGAPDEPTVLVWADVLGQARVQARAPVRYFVLMAAAGVIASLAVMNDNATLVVGAMAISPDLLPVTAACTGIVLGRRRLVQRGLVSLALGLGTAGLFAVCVSAALDHLGLLPEGFALHEFSVAQTHVNATTILVAFAAGVAGMLAVETRASSAVGVAISVATIPATAYLGVALGVGQLRSSLSGFAVLGANVVFMVAGGSIALAVQRAAAVKDELVHPRPAAAPSRPAPRGAAPKAP